MLERIKECGWQQFSRLSPARQLAINLRRLDFQIRWDFEGTMFGLRKRIEADSGIEEQLAVTKQVADIHREVRRLLSESGSNSSTQANQQLARSSQQLLEGMSGLTESQFTERATLARAYNHLSTTQARITRIRAEQLEPEPKSIVMPSALLHQAYCSLFPPERMKLASAKRIGNALHLTGLYGVTGHHSRGGVRADPDKMRDALLAMDATETFLLAWIHSHPGTGPDATWPSAIDLRQQQDWLKHYTPHLVGLIMTEDGYARFWGTSLEKRQTQLKIVGPGIQRTGEQNVYRICQSAATGSQPRLYAAR